MVRLKKTYSSREVAALTGLSARQLQWWDAKNVLAPTVASHRTAAGGFTERRYSPVELYELLVLADLRRRGFSVHRIRELLRTLERQFGVRLYDTIRDGGDVTLLTDGREIYARTSKGEFFNLLREPGQPLLVLGEGEGLKELSSRARSKRPKKRTAQTKLKTKKKAAKKATKSGA
ncbi:MAG: MerR family transcriptional regulator [Vicinamibacterales bacterium]|nr:MerR family transcriptional regulator [Vicinamibacterales bacterium]MDP7471433.1 MerR family transcriptional regulator [Vicinamibacterales bacterium]MDP7671641.1 MerR family transcriptional regulator [Vicinamibacterales bacterium]HJO37027.1 MerR family transcriptional regulator [Vicinamibacterales bacterium]